MFWLVVASAVALSFLLGALTQIRIVVLALPPLAVALAYWNAVGWNGDAYDIGRSGLLLISGIVSVFFVSVCVIGSVVGRFVRWGAERPESSPGVDS
jgi:hypothetical protein